MTRDTKEFSTPGGHKIVIKTYLTSREAMPVFDQADMSGTQKAQKLASAAIVSIDGDANDISEKLLDFSLQEYTATLKEITELISDLAETKSSTSGGASSSTDTQTSLAK
jgi:hypothetical protein